MKDKRQVLEVYEITSDINICRYCIKKIGKKSHFCNDDCFSKYLVSILK